MPSESKLGWIWPKDPRPGNPHHWPRRWRLFDVLTGKGPDIYVGRLKHRTTGDGSQSPHTSSGGPGQGEWSGWDNDEWKPRRKPFPWAQRNADERYDFRTREYTIPDDGTWSGVRYCNGTTVRRSRWGRKKEEVHCVPRRYWDWNGAQRPGDYWHNTIHGRHRD